MAIISVSQLTDLLCQVTYWFANHADEVLVWERAQVDYVRMNVDHFNRTIVNINLRFYFKFPSRIHNDLRSGRPCPSERGERVI